MATWNHKGIVLLNTLMRDPEDTKEKYKHSFIVLLAHNFESCLACFYILRTQQAVTLLMPQCIKINKYINNRTKIDVFTKHK